MKEYKELIVSGREAGTLSNNGYTVLVTEFYTVCMHFSSQKMKLLKAGLEIFNSRQNRIQYEKHYETKAINFQKLKNNNSPLKIMNLYVTVASKYIKQIL